MYGEWLVMVRLNIKNVGASLVLLLVALSADAAAEKRCLLVYSYHVGYAWNDAVDRGATDILNGQCEIRRLYMDSKRNPDVAFIQQRAAEAYALIETWQPDVVIAADDNASKHLVVPYMKDHTVPVIYCGVNWTTEEYGYPFSNVTGMVEMAPLEPLFLLVEQLIGGERHSEPRRVKQLHFIDADRFSAHKEYDRIRSSFESEQMQFHAHFVETFEQWKAAYLQAQQGDVVMLLNHAGIQGWNQQEAEQFVAEQGRVLSIGVHDWMKELNMVTMAKEPEEQGEWAAEAVRLVLSGSAVSDIPPATNRRWNSFVNRTLLEKSGIVLPEMVTRRATWVGE